VGWVFCIRDRARLVLIRGGSHFLPLEERDQLREVLRDFLAPL
jgi:hypothetical protein